MNSSETASIGTRITAIAEMSMAYEMTNVRRALSTTEKTRISRGKYILVTMPLLPTTQFIPPVAHWRKNVNENTPSDRYAQ